MKCSCREVLQDHVLQRVSHPFRDCPFYGTFTALEPDYLPPGLPLVPLNEDGSTDWPKFAGVLLDRDDDEA